MNSSEDIKNWIFNILSKNTKEFNNFPICPYAKDAWIENKILVKDIKYFELEAHLIMRENFNKVTILVLDPTTVRPFYLNELAKRYTDKNFIILIDHPDEEEKVGDIVLNMGKYALVFIQPRKELELGRKYLLEKGYYNNFDKEYLKGLFSR